MNVPNEVFFTRDFDERVKALTLPKALASSYSIVSLPVNCPLNDDILAGFGKGGAIECMCSLIQIPRASQWWAHIVMGTPLE